LAEASSPESAPASVSSQNVVCRAPFVHPATLGWRVVRCHTPIVKANPRANPRPSPKVDQSSRKMIDKQRLAGDAEWAPDQKWCRASINSRVSIRPGSLACRKIRSTRYAGGIEPRPNAACITHRMQIDHRKTVYGGDGWLAYQPMPREKAKPPSFPLSSPGRKIAAFSWSKSQASHAKTGRRAPPFPGPCSPPCPHFGSCGGCHYQHATYAEQLRIKTEILREKLRRLAKLEFGGSNSGPRVAPLEFTETAHEWAFAHEPGFELGYRRWARNKFLAVETWPNQFARCSRKR